MAEESGFDSRWLTQMKRTILLTALILAITGVSAAQQLHGTFDDSFDDFTAGEQDTVTGTIENTGDRTYPFALELTVVSEEHNLTDLDAALTVAAALDDELLDCYFTGTPTIGQYWCTSDDGMPPHTEHPFTVLLDSESRLAPGAYHFTLDLQTRPGIPAKPERTVMVKDTTTVDLPRSQVYVNPAKPATVTVAAYDHMLVDPPANKTFLGGVYVSSDKPANGTLRLQYDRSIDRDTAAIHRFDQETNMWTPIDSTVNTSAQYIEAEVDRFSSYAAYAHPAEEDDTPDEGDDSNDQDDDGAEDSTDREYTSLLTPCTADDWQCSDWSACEDGTQTRDCERRTTACTTDAAYAHTPEEVRDCTVDPTDTDTTDREEPDQDEEPDEQDDSSADADAQTDDPDTADAAIGALTGRITNTPVQTGITAAIILLLLAAGMYRFRGGR